MSKQRYPILALALAAFPCLLPACSDGAEPTSSSTEPTSGGEGGGGNGSSGGNGGSGGSGGSSCNGVAVELSDDPTNCGVCGRDCLGGACAEGQCQPIELAQVTSTLGGNRLAVEGGHVYWTDSADIKWMPVAGGAATTAVNLPGRSFTSLAVHEDYIYWCLDAPEAGSADQRLVMRAKVDQGEVTTLAHGDSSGDPNDKAIPGTLSKLAIDATSVYWLGFGTGRIYSAALMGDGATVATVSSNFYAGEQPGQGPIVAGGAAYWIDFLGRVSTAKTGGGELQIVNTGKDQVFGMASDGKTLYWTGHDQDEDGSATVLQSMALQGGSINELGKTAFNESTALETDGAHVYGFGNGALVRVPVAGGEPVVLTAAADDTSALAVDATSVYWIRSNPNGSSGALMKLAK